MKKIKINKFPYKELIRAGNDCFNFHPDTEHESIAGILNKANKYLPLAPQRIAILLFAEHMAKYIDEQRKGNNND